MIRVTSFFLPGFENRLDVLPISDVAADCFAHGIPQPGFGVGFRVCLQYFSHHRGQRTDILLVEGEDVRLVRVWQGAGSPEISQGEPALPQRFEAARTFGVGRQKQHRRVRVVRGLGAGKQQPFFEQLRQSLLPAGIFCRGHVIEQDELLHYFRGAFLLAEQLKKTNQEQHRVAPKPNAATDEIRRQADVQVVFRKFAAQETLPRAQST